MQEIIKIEFRIFANLRDILGFKIVFLDVKKGISIRDFLYIISDKYPDGPEFLRNVISFENKEVLPLTSITRKCLFSNLSDTAFPGVVLCTAEIQAESLVSKWGDLIRPQGDFIMVFIFSEYLVGDLLS